MGEILKINGNRRLEGEVVIGGAKNSLVALIPAAIITRSIVVLNNIKPIDDTYNLISILRKLNVKVEYDGGTSLKIDARNITNTVLDNEEVLKLRASYYFMGALLALYDNVAVAGPGGCNLGDRPIDLHLEVFSSLGISSEFQSNVYFFYKDKRKRREFTFRQKSVGATVNAILASCRRKGKVVFKNCALEPEIDDLISFLNRCGCCIKRKKEEVHVRGKANLHGCEYKVMSDRIEAGTFMIISSIIGEKVRVKNINTDHLKSLIDVFEKIGVNFECKKDSLTIYKGDDYKGVDVIVNPYPGFPTDLQQPLSVLLSVCEGVSSIKETIYPARLSHVESLNKMGANIEIKDDLIVIEGDKKFHGECVSGKDLRGGISLVVAALAGEGESKVSGVKYIKRGYSDLVDNLRRLGADVDIEEIDDEEKND